MSSVYTMTVSAGFHVYGGALYIKTVLEYQHNRIIELTLDTKEVVMFAGAAFITLCWCFMLMLSVSYKTKPKRNHYEIFDPPHGASRRRQKCRVPFTPRAARGLSILFILLSLEELKQL